MEEENKGEENHPAADSDWILDSLVAYLRGPIWVMPILTFIEQKSVVFDGQGDHEVEFRQIHDAYRNLVDCMLGAYMDDLGLQPEDLETALGQIQPSVRSAALQTLLEPVQAASDYDQFKELMRVKNEQLHNEALEMLRRKRGEDQLLADGDDEEIVFSQDDINEAIRQSLAHHAAERNALVAEKRQVDHAMAVSVAGLLTSNAAEEAPAPSSTELANVPPESDTARKGGAPDPAQVEERRAKLRAQRDKILSQKQKERERHLQNQQGRPKSGRAARAALAGETAPQVDERTIQFRRLLLQKIKEEVEGQPRPEN